MVAQSTEASVAELTEREIECGRRLAAAMFGLGKQQASIGARISKVGGFDRSAIILLKTLAALGPSRSSALAAAVHSDPSTVSRQVAALVDRGLVERLADPHDGRATLLAATEAGKERHRLVHDRRERAFARMVADWPEQEVRDLAALLGRLNDSFLEHRASLLDAITAQETS